MGAEHAAREVTGMGITASPSKYPLARGASPTPGPSQPSHGEGGVSGLGFFSPMLRNWANLLFVSHMGSQMDGEEGVG